MVHELHRLEKVDETEVDVGFRGDPSTKNIKRGYLSHQILSANGYGFDSSGETRLKHTTSEFLVFTRPSWAEAATEQLPDAQHSEGVCSDRRHRSLHESK